MVTALGMVPLLFVGQTAFGTLTTTVGGQATDTLINDTNGAPNCSTMVTGTWTAALTGAPCSSLVMWLTSASDCEALPTGTDVTLSTTPSTLLSGTSAMHTGSTQFTVSTMLSAGSDAGTSVACGAIGIEQTYLLCASVSMDQSLLCTTKQTVQTTVASMNAASIKYDTKAPGAPVLNSVDPLDGALSASFGPGADTDTANDFFQLQIAQGDAGVFTNVTGGEIPASTTTSNVSGLTDGTPYTIRLYAVDAAGNQSGYSNEISATPVASSGFWGQYRKDEGGAVGCAMDPAALVLLLAAAPLLRRRRR
jgi:hypothetical protein